MKKRQETRVIFRLDYGDHYVSMLREAEGEDREKLIAYGEILSEGREGAVVTFVVGYCGDGWDARGWAEETEAEIGAYASFEKSA